MQTIMSLTISKISTFKHCYLASMWFSYAILLLTNPPAISADDSSVDNNNETNITILHDPTKPKNSLAKNLDANDANLNNEKDFLNLSLILIKEDNKSAIINQRSFKELEQVNGLQIIKIENNRVLLQPPTSRDFTLEQQLNQLSSNNRFIKEHLLDNYIVLNLPKKRQSESIIDFNHSTMLNDKKNL